MTPEHSWAPVEVSSKQEQTVTSSCICCLLFEWLRQPPPANTGLAQTRKGHKFAPWVPTESWRSFVPGVTAIWQERSPLLQVKFISSLLAYTYNIKNFQSYIIICHLEIKETFALEGTSGGCTVHSPAQSWTVFKVRAEDLPFLKTLLPWQWWI